MQNFGETIKTLRKNSDLTQSQFADRLGVHLQTISKWERGLLAPDFSLLGEIAAVLSVSLEKLLELPEGEECFSGTFDMEAFGRALAEARKIKNESQNELAEKLGVSTDNISKWERGVTCPDVSLFIALTNHFLMPASKLYFGICEEEQTQPFVQAQRRSETQVALPVQVKRKKKFSPLLIACALLPLCAVIVVLAVFLSVRPGETSPDTPSVGTETQNPEEDDNPAKEEDPPERLMYNISYWLCGGAFEEDVPMTICKGDGEIVLATPKKEGSDFLGWYRMPDYSGVRVSSITCENRDIILYAKWSILTFEIRYELAGGSLYKNNPAYVSAQESRPLLDPTKKGYLFLGWYDDFEEGERYDRVGGEGAKNMTLYARWQKCDEKFTIQYVLKGGKLAEKNPTTVEAGEVFPLNSPEKRGYDFLGWNTYENGSGEYITTLYNVSENLILYAVFKPKTYLIRYEYEGHYLGDEANPNRITFGERVDLLPVTLYGHEFLGWFTEEEGGTKVDTIDEDNLPELSVLYARFSPMAFTVFLDAGEGSFEIDGATLSKGSLPARYGERVTLPTPSREGYVFLGWLDEEGNKVKEISLYQLDDISLFARWRPEGLRYNIFYALDGGTQNELNPTEGIAGESMTLYDPTREGYIFLGWYDNREGRGERYYFIPEDREEDIVLYALWQKI